MRRWGSSLLEFIHWLEFGYLLALLMVLLAFIFDLAGLAELRWLAAQPWHTVLLYTAAALSFGACLHFLVLILRARRLRHMIRQETRDGSVLVSARALQRLIEESLSKAELEKARVRLVPRRRGLDIIVELKGVQADLVGAAERVQRLLRQRVEFEAGIRVRRIEIRTLSLKRQRTRARKAKRMKPLPQEQFPELPRTSSGAESGSHDHPRMPE